MHDRRNHSSDTPENWACGRSPELALLLACARWPQEREEDRQRIRALCAGEIDWDQFLLLVQHHRLVPLVAQTLQASMESAATPQMEEAVSSLRRLAVFSAHRALRSLAELRRVAKALQEKNIPVRVLKGLPLAQSIFGDLSLRAPGDIDLLIDESCILEADRLLRDFGYRGIYRADRFTPRQFAFYRSHWKDLAYENPETGFEVDLHWRCFRNSRMPGARLCATAAGETVSFGGFAVKTLPRLENLLYLCVHGTLDGWLYFKSLVDVATQVRTMDEEQLDELAKLASSYDVLPELTATLMLVRRYLHMDHWSAQLLPENDRTVRHILRYTDQTLVEGGFLAERESIPIATTLAFELGLRRNFRYRMELLLRVLYRARMWETIPLPDFLFGIYPLLSPLEWAIFRLRQWGAKPRHKATIAI